jgi:NADPH-dependent 2,4-dienoyl-CoA reductase/sulfur reductase-like enzyme
VTHPQRVVVAGASYAGLRAAESLRRTGFDGEVVLVGADPHEPYDRPSLTKDLLSGSSDRASIALPLPASLGDVTWRLGCAVTSSDLGSHRLTLDDGTDLSWDGLVVATGLRSKHVPITWDPPRLAVRSLEESERLGAVMRRARQAGRRMVVVGAGFIGCEVAAVGAELGLHVTVVAPEPVPLLRPLGPELGAALQRRHEAAGVTFALGRVPIAVRGDAGSAEVELSDGSRLQADLVVEAVGCTPVVDWLEDDDAELSDGVLADAHLRVLSATTSEPLPGVVACGDVARFPNPLFDTLPRRVEHWTMAADTGKRAGRTLGLHLTGAPPDPKPFQPVPTFWSEQYGLRLQSFGLPELGEGDVRVLDGSLDDDLDRGVVVGYHRQDVLTGVVMVGFEERYRHYRTAIGQAA